MKRGSVLGVLLALILMTPSIGTAESWDLNLSAGGNSVIGGIHFKSYLDTGYMRMGGTGIFIDDDETELKLGKFDFTVGSDTLMPGLNIDMGLFGVMGSAEEENESGDVGSAGFIFSASYYFPPDVMVIPLEISAGYSWGPKVLSFSDTENYNEFNLGLGLRIIKNASITLSYSNYSVDMETRGREWDLNHDTYQLGLSMRF